MNHYMKIPIETLENMYPFERDIYIYLFNEMTRKEKERDKKDGGGFGLDENMDMDDMV